MNNLKIVNKNNWFIDKLKNFGDKVAIIHEDKKYTYSDLIIHVKRMGKFLSDNNIKQEDVIAILSEYSFRSIALFLALLENKNIIVPITSKVNNEIEERLKESYTDKKISLEEKTIKIGNIGNNQEKHSLIQSVQKNNHSGLILFSSGSTGKPKAMIHNLDTLLEPFKDKRERDSNILVFLMFDHIGGLNTLFNALSAGSTITVPQNQNADYICSIMEKYKVNVLPTSPTFLNLMLISGSYKKYNLSSLKLITYGTEPMPEILLGRLKNIFPNVKLLQTFGTSETGITKTSSKSSTSTLMKIDDKNTKYKIVNGELWLKSHTQVLGYLNYKMDNFTSDGWYKTGDLVEETKDGYLKILGRTKEIINVGGQKVLPSEIESVLLSMSGIADCMVYGEKNAIMGQIVAADVVLNQEIDVNSIKKEIRKYCKNKLDDYKIPTKVNVVDKTNFGDRFKKIRTKTGNKVV